MIKLVTGYQRDLVDPAIIYGTDGAEPIVSLIFLPEVVERLGTPEGAEKADMVTDQHRADGYLVRTWWTFTEATRSPLPPRPPDMKCAVCGQQLVPRLVQNEWTGYQHLHGNPRHIATPSGPWYGP